MSIGEIKEADALTHAARLAYGVLAARRAASEAHAERNQLEQAQQLNEALSQLHLSRVSQMTERFRYTRPHMFISPSMPHYVGAGPAGAANQPPMYPTDIPVGADMGMVRLASLEKEAGFSLPGAIRGAVGGAVGKVRNLVSKATPMGMGHLKSPIKPGAAPASARAGMVAAPDTIAPAAVRPPRQRGMVGAQTQNMSQTMVHGPASVPAAASVAPAPAGLGIDFSKNSPGAAGTPYRQAPAPSPVPAAGSGQTVGQVMAPTPAPQPGLLRRALGGAGTAIGLGVAGLGVGGALLSSKAVEVGGRVMSQEPPPANFYQGGYVVPHSPSAYGYVG